MTDYLMRVPTESAAEQIAAELRDDEAFTEVRIIDDAARAEWGVFVRQTTIDDPASAVARALATRFEELAHEHGGSLDPNPAQLPPR